MSKSKSSKKAASDPRGGPGGVLWNEALGCVPGAATGVRRVTRLGGNANANWRVETADGNFVVRLHGEWTHAAGVNRQREVLLHETAAQAGLAPSLIAADPAGRFLVTPFVAGTVWQSADLGNPLRLIALSRRLARLHELPPPETTPWSLADLLAEHVQALADAGREVETLLPLLEQARTILTRCATAGRPPCIVHNDLNPANLIGPEPLLLDWEYAAVADPLSDLATLLAYHPRVARHLPLLLSYTDRPAEEEADLRDLVWVYTLVSWLWYQRYELAQPLAAEQSAAMDTLRRRLGPRHALE